MKNIQNISANLERQLIRAFAMLDAWFDADDIDSHHTRDLLVSIIRQNQELLSRISDEAPDESVDMTRDPAYRLLTPTRVDCAVGDASDVYHVSCQNRVDGNQEMLAELRRELRNQLEFCLDQLDAMRNSERPSDHRIAVVESLINLDIYQYIRCIMQITRRGYEDISEGSKQ